MKTQLRQLVHTLDQPARLALEAAAGHALARTHFDIEPEHLLEQLLLLPEGRNHLAACHVDVLALEAALQGSLAQFRRGHSRNPSMSAGVLEWMEAAWLFASVTLRAESLGVLPLLHQLVVDPELQDGFGSLGLLLGAGRGEVSMSRLAGPQTGAPTVAAPAEALERYTQDLTAAAREGRLDPVIGREPEIRQVMDILLRRRQNNPILTGEAGVGKTAVVEGLARAIVAGQVPGPLQHAVVRSLDLGLLQAGAGMKGEFEARLRAVIDGVRGSVVPIVLFIDEAHNLLGAGGAQGQGDAANLLKPALARGELRTIAATTWSEYKRYFEKDAALTRRFQVVKVDEPAPEVAVTMLRSVVPSLERHHGVRILDAAVRQAVHLSARYLSGRQLPDKAVSLLDTACARVALSQVADPSCVVDLERERENLERELAALVREGEPGADESRPHEIRVRMETLEQELRGLRDQLEGQRTHLVEAQKTLKAHEAAADAGNRERAAAARRAFQDSVRERALVHLEVDEVVVADVLSEWTGIPLGSMQQDEMAAVRGLESGLKTRIIGQEAALGCIARQLQAAWAGLADPRKPRGVFLLTGPSGVGKTETALALAEQLYGGERNLITLNLSEFQEPHTVSLLKGSPPGYVGYGEGGRLTEGVRRRPYCVVLLDEIEKAHPDVLEVFYQVFDKGEMEDSEGRRIDFRNTVILLTSNLGDQALAAAGEASFGDLQKVAQAVLAQHFKPAFLGRLSVVPYRGLDETSLQQILELRMRILRDRMAKQHRLELTWDARVVALLQGACGVRDSGARHVEAIVHQNLVVPLADALLGQWAEGATIQSAKYKVHKGALRLELR